MKKSEIWGIVTTDSWNNFQFDSRTFATKKQAEEYGKEGPSFYKVFCVRLDRDEKKG